MTIHVLIGNSGTTRLPSIRNALRRPEVQANLRKLIRHPGQQLEVTYPLRGRYIKHFSDGSEFTTGIDSHLKDLGVYALYAQGNDNEILVEHGVSSTIDQIEAHMQEIENQASRTTVLLHGIQTDYFPGIPRDDLLQLSELSGVNVETADSGSASPAGVVATGNFGAISFLQRNCRARKAKIGLLNGGHATRLFGMRKLKGSVEFGSNNLAIWNIYSGLYFQDQMPENSPYGEYIFTLANDGILVSLGPPAAYGTLLRKTSPAQAKEGYFILCPDNEVAMPKDEDTQRFGMVAIRSNGDFICATEKLGRNKTLAMALQRLIDQGIQAHPDEIRLYINYFAMATTEKLEEDIAHTLNQAVKPNLNADEIADFDTYALVFAAMSSPSAEEFREAIKDKAFFHLFVEDSLNQLYLNMRQVLFDAKTGQPRIGFADLGRGALAIDIGTLESYSDFEMDLIRNHDAFSASRDKFLGYLRKLEQEHGVLSSEEKEEIAAWENLVRNTQRMVRHLSQRVAGFDPSLTIEKCEFSPVLDPKRAPILGVPAPHNARETPDVYGAEDIAGGIQDLIIKKHNGKLWECRALNNGQLAHYGPEEQNKQGELLYFYDPEGIKSLKLSGCRIRPGTVICRNVVAINSDLGSETGSEKVIIAENGAIVGSKVEASIMHPPRLRISKAELDKDLEKIARERTAQKRLELSGGWTAVLTYDGSQRADKTMQQIQKGLAAAGTQEQRRIAEIEHLRAQLGIVKREEPIIFDMNTGINLLQIKGSDLAVSSADPSEVHQFQLHAERKELPPYMVYGKLQREALTITEPKLYASRQPVANDPPVDYEVPFNANPATYILPFLGGIVMKDERVQEEFGYFTRFRWRSDQELLDKNLIPPLVTAIEATLQNIKAAESARARGGTFSVTSINKEQMIQAIRDAINRGLSVKTTIMYELQLQTPAILSDYFARVTGKSKKDIEAALVSLKNETTPGNKRSLGLLLDELRVADPATKRTIRDIIHGYPFSPLLFTEYSLTPRAFARKVSAVIKQFRMEEVPLFDPLDETKTISVKMDKDQEPILPNQQPTAPGEQ